MIVRKKKKNPCYASYQRESKFCSEKKIVHCKIYLDGPSSFPPRIFKCKFAHFQKQSVVLETVVAYNLLLFYLYKKNIDYISIISPWWFLGKCFGISEMFRLFYCIFFFFCESKINITDEPVILDIGLLLVVDSQRQGQSPFEVDCIRLTFFSFFHPKNTKNNGCFENLFPEQQPSPSMVNC